MSKEYDPKEIEGKWQEEWQKLGVYQAKDFSLPAQAGGVKDTSAIKEHSGVAQW